MNVREQSFFLPSHGRMLAATCFAPERVGAAVLFVAPFVEERKGALPVIANLARRLAGEGVASLYFDFAGCGDSEGDFAEVPPGDFERDCEAAYAWLAGCFPALPRVVLGVRTGAVLAARLAVNHPEVAAVALWSPVAGADFFKQLAQRRMVNDMVAYGKATESRAALEARLQNGGTVDMDGYPVSGVFYQWLQTLTLTPAAPVTPTFLATGGHDEKGAAAAFPDAPALTRSVLRYPPFWNTVGHVDLSALLDETAGWLMGCAAMAGAPVTVALQECGRVSAGGAFEELAAGEGGGVARVALDCPPTPPVRGVLFLHGWSGDRTGPHRLFTRFARVLAARGCLCIRPDFIGRGLSDGGGASIRGMAETAQGALDVLRGRLPQGAPVTVVAICSGCKVAVALASRNPEIDRLMLWSAESMGSLRSAATGSRKTVSALKTYLRKLTRPETWRKILTGKVQTGMVTKALVKHETRTKDEAVWEDDVLRVFARHRNPVSFVFGGSDPDAAGSRQAYERYCAKHGIPHTRHTIPHAGHSYYSEAWTRELMAVSVDEMFGGGGAREGR